MHKKFEINRTKIKGSCQSGRKVVTHDSKSDLALSLQKLISTIVCNIDWDVVDTHVAFTEEFVVEIHWTLVTFYTGYSCYYETCNGETNTRINTEVKTHTHTFYTSEPFFKV